MHTIVLWSWIWTWILDYGAWIEQKMFRSGKFLAEILQKRKEKKRKEPVTGQCIPSPTPCITLYSTPNTKTRQGLMRMRLGPDTGPNQAQLTWRTDVEN